MHCSALNVTMTNNCEMEGSGNHRGGAKYANGMNDDDDYKKKKKTTGVKNRNVTKYL